MANVLEDKTTYEMLYLEIDLDEQKFKKLAQKQPEINRAVEESIQDVTQFNTPVEKKTETSAPKPQSELRSTSENTATPVAQVATVDDLSLAEDLEESADDELPPMNIGMGDITPSELIQQFETQYGISPGMTVQEQRAQKAEANGLSFACVGRQPVEDIWQIYPARKHKMEAFSLALDIAESVGLMSYVEHIVKEPVDYSYKMKPLTESVSATAKMCYDLLCLLETNAPYEGEIAISPIHLLDEISDVTLVKIFRLIRVVRYIRTQGVSHDNV